MRRPNPSRKKNEEFLKFIQAAKDFESLSPLSFIHTTDLFRLGEIEETGELRPQSVDKYFKDSVLYFFYGRPSYRVHPEIQKTRISSFAPICFIFKPSSPIAMRRSYPFDSGAFIDGRMDMVMHRDFSVEDFEIEPNENGPKKIISTFYGSNQNYMGCFPSDGPNNELLAQNRLHRVEAYNEIIRFIRNDGNDERVHSIEMQTTESVPLKGNIIAVVVPARFFNDIQKKKLEDEWGCIVVCYHMQSVFTPSDLMSLIFDKVINVLVQNDQIP